MPDSSQEILILTPLDFADLADGLIAKGSAVRFKARGQSMRPFIRDGDILTVTPVKTSMLRKGHVVLCQTDTGNLVAHRIHSISKLQSETMLTVCGDSQLNSMETIRADQVLGLARDIERNGTIINITGAFTRIRNLLRFRFLKLHHLIRLPVLKRNSDRL